MITENDEIAEEASRENEVERDDEKRNECVNNLEVEAEEVSQENSIPNEMRDENGKELENDEESCRATNHDILPITTGSDDVVPVYCTATVGNCPDSVLTDDYYQSIRRFLVSEEHLMQNISSAELQYVSCSRNNLHTHTISIVMYVRTARLWESPSSYVRNIGGKNIVLSGDF